MNVFSNQQLYNSSSTVCPPVRDDPRVSVGDLSPVQAENRGGITILYELQQCRPAQYEIFRAKVCDI